MWFLFQKAINPTILHWQFCVTFMCSRSNFSSIRAGYTSLGGCNTWRRTWQPTPVLLPGESHGRKRLVGYSPRDRKESNTTERLTQHTTLWMLVAEGTVEIIYSNHIFQRNLFKLRVKCLIWSSKGSWWSNVDIMYLYPEMLILCGPMLYSWNNTVNNKLKRTRYVTDKVDLILWSFRKVTFFFIMYA